MKFVQFNKLDTGSSTKTSPIIVRADSVSLCMPILIHDKETGVTTTGTRITVSDSNEYAFTVNEPIADVAAFLQASTLTSSGLVGICNTEQLIVTPQIAWPHILLDRVINSLANMSEKVLINPNMIVWAEETLFYDSLQQHDVAGVTLTIWSNSRPIQTLLSFAELTSLLNPAVL